MSVVFSKLIKKVLSNVFPFISNKTYRPGKVEMTADIIVEFTTCDKRLSRVCNSV